MKNYSLVVKNKVGNYGEILTDFDYGSFKTEWSHNDERQVSFTAYRTSRNFDVFDMLTNENIVSWEGQDYTIKQTTLKHDNVTVSNEIVAKHISLTFQDHYVNADQSGDTLNEEVLVVNDDDTSEEEEETGPEYTLEQYLEFGFKNNQVGMTYKIVGDFPQRAAISELGNKNGIEYIVEGAELFGYVYYADNKEIVFYTEEEFNKLSEKLVLRYKYNTQDVSAACTTTDLKTYAQGFGKKRTKTETKNYYSVLPKNLKISGSYNKDGTWYCTTVGGYYEKTFNCKYGNEVLIWNNKRAKYGGNVDVYLDGEKIGAFSQYSKNAKTSQVVVARGLEKGEHVFKAVFRGARSGVNYGSHKPRMYANTAKGKVLNLTAILQDKTLYHAWAEVKAPNYEAFGHMEGATLYSKTATTEKELIAELQANINDIPNIELSTSYIGYDEINEWDILHFIHEPLNFNDDLKVVKLTKYHPYTNTPCEVEFSNSAKDMVSIQRQLVKRINNANSSMAYGGMNTSVNYYEGYTDVVGSVIVDD